MWAKGLEEGWQQDLKIVQQCPNTSHHIRSTYKERHQHKVSGRTEKQLREPELKQKIKSKFFLAKWIKGRTQQLQCTSPLPKNTVKSRRKILTHNTRRYNWISLAKLSVSEEPTCMGQKKSTQAYCGCQTQGYDIRLQDKPISSGELQHKTNTSVESTFKR